MPTMERHFEHELDQVRDLLLTMGGRVERMIESSTEALLERDTALADQVIEDDHAIDQLELEIDEACYSIIVRHHPTARDLRLLIAVINIVTDLERMGDSTVNIAQSVKELNLEPPLKPYVDLPRMSAMVTVMVRESLDSFVRRDSKLAKRVCESDDQVDALYHQVFTELEGFMTSDTAATHRALHLLLISRNLERIADHATNIAEDVVYYVEGRDIRHSGPKQASL